ncbi:hypothetical protein D9M68_991230 [compost metagenome]
MSSIVHFIDGLNRAQFVLLGTLLFWSGLFALMYLDYEVVRPFLARFRPPAGCESPGSVVTAPSGVVQPRGTPNHLAWLHVRLFLESGPMPSVEVIGPHSCGNSVQSKETVSCH